MFRNFRDLTGGIYGRLTVIERSGTRNGNSTWVCQCACGSRVTVYATNITRGQTKSCGCIARELTSLRARKHGMSFTDEYRLWRHMIQRCYSPNNNVYKNYGERGIIVCDRWRNSFENFFSDMGRRPSTRHSIDRIDNEGNYEPGNCRWATKVQQSNNTRVNRRISLNGYSMTITEWSRKLGINCQVIRRRAHQGLPVEEVLSVYSRTSKTKRITDGKDWERHPLEVQPLP